MELENSRKRNTTSNIIKLFFCMCFVFVAFLFKNNINAATYGILEYKEINNGTEIEITGCDKNATGTLNIPSTIDGKPVTSIGEKAFYECSNFTGSLVIPDSVTQIGDYAFYGCKNLTGDLVIPDSVTSIGESAFRSCYGFNGKLVIPESVTSIGFDTFDACWGFTGDLIIPNSVTSIGDFAFWGCGGFTGDLVIPDSVTSIGDKAFKECSGFTGNLVIPDGVTSIGEEVFYNCINLTGDLIIPGSVTSIGFGAFEKCSGFTGKLVIPDSVTSIGDKAFKECSGFTGNLVIPDGVTSIGKEAFYNCKNLTGDLIIPGSVTSIGDYAFYGCKNLTGDLVIPDSVTSIGESAFRSCYGFNGKLVIPESVTSIGNNAFYNCKGFTGDLVIPDSVTSIGDDAFRGCSGFNGKLVIPNRVKNIGDYAFSGCDGITGDLIIPDSVTSIGNNAFYYCKGFTGDLVIPDSVTSIGDYAFSGCDGVTGDLIIPDSVTSIGKRAFDCNKIKRVVFYADSPEVGEYCFGKYSSTIVCPRFPIYYRKGTTGFTADNNYDVSRLVPYELKLVSTSIKITDFSNSKYIKLADYDYDFIGDLVKGISYTSDDENIASVESDGRIITKHNGKTKVNAIVSIGNNIKATLSEDVDVDIQLVTSISLDKEKLDFIFTNTQKINATVLPDNAVKKTLKWTSSDENVAVVDENGVVRAVANGSAIITCTTTDGSDISKSVNVTVSDIPKGFSNKGDINNDGKVDLVDVFLVYNTYLKNTENTSIDESLLVKTDLNGDKKTDLLDVYLTYNIYLKRSAAVNGFSLTYKVGEGGTVSDSSRVVKNGQECKVSVTPNTGYKFDGWYVNNKLISTDNTLSFTMPNGDVTIEAKFAKKYVSLVRQMGDYTSNIIGDDGHSVITVKGENTIVYVKDIGAKFNVASGSIALSYSSTVDGSYASLGNISSDSTYTANKVGYYKFSGNSVTINTNYFMENNLTKVSIEDLKGSSSYIGNRISTGSGGNVFFKADSNCVLSIESADAGSLAVSDSLDGTYTNVSTISSKSTYNLEKGKYYRLGGLKITGYIKDLNGSAVNIVGK